MEQKPIRPRDDGPIDQVGARLENRLVIVVFLAVVAVVFAVAAWWPGGHDALGLGEGFLAVGIGVLVVLIPTGIAVAVSSGIRLVWLRFLMVVPLAVIAMFVGFVWKALIDMTRAEVGIH